MLFTVFAVFGQRQTTTLPGFIGLNTPNPISFLTIEGDVYLDDPTRGIILTSPNGNCWKVTVNDSGALQNVQIVCPS